MIKFFLSFLSIFCYIIFYYECVTEIFSNFIKIGQKIKIIVLIFHLIEGLITITKNKNHTQDYVIDCYVLENGFHVLL